MKTTLSMKALKKLILDTCQKTALTCDNIIYEQKDFQGIHKGLQAFNGFVNNLKFTNDKFENETPPS